MNTKSITNNICQLHSTVFHRKCLRSILIHSFRKANNISSACINRKMASHNNSICCNIPIFFIHSFNFTSSIVVFVWRQPPFAGELQPRSTAPTVDRCWNSSQVTVRKQPTILYNFQFSTSSLWYNEEHTHSHTPICNRTARKIFCCVCVCVCYLCHAWIPFGSPLPRALEPKFCAVNSCVPCLQATVYDVCVCRRRMASYFSESKTSPAQMINVPSLVVDCSGQPHSNGANRHENVFKMLYSHHEKPKNSNFINCLMIMQLIVHIKQALEIMAAQTGFFVFVAASHILRVDWILWFIGNQSGDNQVKSGTFFAPTRQKQQSYKKIENKQTVVVVPPQQIIYQYSNAKQVPCVCVCYFWSAA